MLDITIVVLHILEILFLQDKSMFIKRFTDEQARVLINLDQHYETWMEAARELAGMPYGMKWAERNGTEYLYEVINRRGNAKSLGRRTPETEAIFSDYSTRKEALQARIASSRETLAATSALYRALKLPVIPSEAARILREADLRGMLGRDLIVVGTIAMPAYSIEAGGIIREAPDTTDDFDLTWVADEPRPEARIMAMLKAVDSTYTVNTERTFQARNAKAFEVEILASPTTVRTMQRGDQPAPIPLPEQEWLLPGRRVSHTVVANDGSPARLVAPDPRWFALLKLWLSEKDGRNPLKKPKDAAQGLALLNAVAAHMPHYPVGQDFADSLPGELLEFFDRWRSEFKGAASPAW
jgi:Uncharacterized conserved protein